MGRGNDWLDRCVDGCANTGGDDHNVNLSKIGSDQGLRRAVYIYFLADVLTGLDLGLDNGAWTRLGLRRRIGKLLDIRQPHPQG